MVTVARKEMKSPMLEDVASWGEDRILSLNNRPYDEYELFNQEYVIINGLQVITREYLMDEETPLPLHKKDVYIARTHDGIILTLSATASNFEEALIIFDHMVASFESIEE